MNCLPTAYSIVMGIPISKIYEIIGHDGTEIWWPDLPEPYCYRTFHIGEMANCCFKLGWVTWPTSDSFELRTMDRSRLIPNPLFEKILKSKDGVFLGECDGVRHAVAWHDQRLINSSKDFIAEEFWVIERGQECPSARS